MFGNTSLSIFTPFHCPKEMHSSRSILNQALYVCLCIAFQSVVASSASAFAAQGSADIWLELGAGSQFIGP